MSNLNIPQRLYSVYDSVSGLFGAPIPMVNDQAAARSFYDLISQGDSAIAKHPTDHDLYYVGSINTSSGVLDSCNPPDLIVKGSSAPSRFKSE